MEMIEHILMLLIQRGSEISILSLTLLPQVIVECVVTGIY